MSACKTPRMDRDSLDEAARLIARKLRATGERGSIHAAIMVESLVIGPTEVDADDA